MRTIAITLPQDPHLIIECIWIFAVIFFGVLLAPIISRFLLANT